MTLRCCAQAGAGPAFASAAWARSRRPCRPSFRPSTAASPRRHEDTHPAPDDAGLPRAPGRAQQGAAADEAPPPPDQAVAAADGGLWAVPWDVWDCIQVTAAVWVVNQSIPYAVLLGAAHLQGTSLQGLPLPEKEMLGFGCQLLQLAATYAIIARATREHQPLPRPWFLVEASTVAVLQGVAAAIVALGSGLLLSGATSGHVDGQYEWQQLAGLGDAPSTLALVAGAVLLAPLTEEWFYRAYLLASMTKWVPPPIAVGLSGVLFAMAHPTDAFLPEAVLGCVFGGALLAGGGNLVVPLLAHAVYNAGVLGAELLLQR